VVYRLQKSKPTSPSDPEYAMGPLSRTDVVGYRAYLRARLMECFGPEDRALTWSVESLLDNLWHLTFYREGDLDVVRRSSAPTLKFRLHDDGTLQPRVEEIERQRSQNKPIRYGDSLLVQAHKTAERLSHTLEVIESYCPGLGQRLGQAAQELLSEPLLEPGDTTARPPPERSCDTASGGIEAPSVGQGP
jgi:hypothetical protein